MWLIGYVFFGYFLFSLYNMLRKAFIQPHVVVLVSVIIVISLAYTVDLVVSTSQLLSIHEEAPGVLLVNIAYPILDGILLIPAVLILWSLLSGIKQGQGPKQQQQHQQHYASFNWILLSLSMIIFAIADSSFAYFSAFNITTPK
jgi:E3 ubiquitin-protein ligase DOA10